jgi:hypothetical protein
MPDGAVLPHTDEWYTKATPLFTKPPRGEPLTDEQINLCWHTARNKADQVNELMMLFARAIEQVITGEKT